jgi:hypothetical protein
MSNNKYLRDGKPCTHPGCLKHVTHPCEGCGRIGGQYPKGIATNIYYAPPKVNFPIQGFTDTDPSVPWAGGNRDIDPFNNEDVAAWRERDKQAAKILNKDESKPSFAFKMPLWSEERLRRMADAEDEAGSVNVGDPSEAETFSEEELELPETFGEVDRNAQFKKFDDFFAHPAGIMQKRGEE